MFIGKKFPHTQQLESKDCGPACLQMLCKYYGHFYDLEYLRELCGIKKEGISVYDFIKASEKIGLRSQAFKLSFWKLRHDVPLPCTVHWRAHHFVVVYKVTSKHVYVSDPQEGTRKYNLTEFASGWLYHVDPELGKKTKRGVCIVTEATEDFRRENTRKQQLTFTSALKFMWDYMDDYKSSIVKILMLMVVITILSVFFPIITQNIVDVGIPTKDYGFITIMLVASLVLTLSNSLGSWIKQLINTHFAARIKLSMQSDFISKMFKLPFSFFENRLMGDIIQRNNDYDRLESFIMTTGFNFVMAVFQLTIFGSILLYYNSFIFWTFIICSVAYVAWILFFWAIRKKMDIRYFTFMARNQSQWIEMLSNMTDIKSYNYGSFKCWQWEKVQIKLFKTRIKLLNVDQMQSMGSTLINSIKDLLLIYIAAMLVSKQQMSMGMLIAVQYILGQLATPTESVIQFIISTQLANISYQRIQEILGKKTESEIVPKIENIDLIDYNQNIALTNVYFKYNVNDDFVLKNISCSLPKGKLIAVVGESGCGKSSLLKLLIGLYPPNSGHLKLGNMSLSSIPVEEWRDRIGVLSQDSALLNESILDNIVFGREYTPEQVEKAVTIANVKKDIESRPMGYGTFIQENGKGVSEGQKQRILLARAIYGNPKYLFLDELTSSLDSNNEFSIINSIKSIESHPTTILVAHRLSSVKNSDMVIVIKDGQIVEMGTHKILFAHKKYYYELFKNQEVMIEPDGAQKLLLAQDKSVMAKKDNELIKN